MYDRESKYFHGSVKEGTQKNRQKTKASSQVRGFTKLT